MGGQDGCEPRSEVFEGVRPGGQGGCERRIEIFVKIRKFKKKNWEGVMGGGSGWWEGFQGGCERNVGGDVGYGGCEPRNTHYNLSNLI